MNLVKYMIEGGSPLSGRVSAMAEFEALEDEEELMKEELPDYLR